MRKILFVSEIFSLKLYNLRSNYTEYNFSDKVQTDQTFIFIRCAYTIACGRCKKILYQTQILYWTFSLINGRSIVLTFCLVGHDAYVVQITVSQPFQLPSIKMQLCTWLTIFDDKLRHMKIYRIDNCSLGRPNESASDGNRWIVQMQLNALRN